MVNPMSSVCIIGAGVSGLSTAIELLSHHHRVIVFADATEQSTTSSTAAAFWYPFWTGSTPDHSWYRPTWAWDTFLALEEFVGNPSSGVCRTRLVEYFDTEISRENLKFTVESMWWRLMNRLNFAMLSRDEVSAVSCAGRFFQSGSAFDTLVVNMSSYLPFLMDRALSLGGSIVTKHVVISDIESLCREFDFVINCAGLGARELVNESKLKPVEGIVVRIAPMPDIPNVILAHTGPIFADRPVYIVPRGGLHPDIVLGGTLNQYVEGQPRHLQWSSLEAESWVVRSDVDMIMEMCRMMEPKLSTAQEIGVSLGYRPVRDPGVRVEPEFGGPCAGKIIHNYGHAGGGVTLSWGCAHEVSRWVEWFND